MTNEPVINVITGQPSAYKKFRKDLLSLYTDNSTWTRLTSNDRLQHPRMSFNGASRRDAMRSVDDQMQRKIICGPELEP